MKKRKNWKAIVEILLHVFLALSLGYGVWRFWEAYQNLGEKRAAEDSAPPSETARWEKKQYVVPVERWQVRDDQSEIVLGNLYYLIQNVEQKFRCSLGLFELRFRNEHRFFFAGSKMSARSKLEEYARANGFPVFTEIVDRRRFYRNENVLMCSQWSYFENNSVSNN